MKTFQTLPILVAAAVVPVLFAFRPAAQKITFAPSAGTKVTKSFTSQMAMSLDDMEVSNNGEPQEMPPMEMDMEVESTIVVTDTYGEVEGGKPKSLTRTYDTIKTSIENVNELPGAPSEPTTGSGTSPLQGETVEFKLEEDGTYARSFAEGSEADTELLAGLTEDMDLRGLLPMGEVAEGDSWDIPLDNLIDILVPGGALGLEIEMEGGGGGGMDPTSMTDLREMLGDTLEGKATGKFTGMREVEGVQLAVIELNMELDSQKDMTDFLTEMMAKEAPPEIQMSMDRVDVEFALESAGELLWNVSAGHAHSLNMEGKSAVAMEMEMSMDFGGQAMSFEMNMEMSGTLKNGMTVE